MNEIVSSLQSKYDKADTVEHCGLVLQDGSIIETPNTHTDPHNGFIIPAKLMLQHEDALRGTWHTHPNDVANLSQSDFAGFSQWPMLEHYIVGVDGVRCFKVANGLIAELDL